MLMPDLKQKHESRCGVDGARLELRAMKITLTFRMWFQWIVRGQKRIQNELMSVLIALIPYCLLDLD
jgi:hypothetical protein